MKGFAIVCGITLLQGLAFAQPASTPQCAVAVFNRTLPATAKVCDRETVARLAKDGRVFEQNQLGIASILMVGPNADVREAVSWFTKAAQRGYAPAQVNLAVLYANGWGVPRNYGVALRWFHEAAAQRYPLAYFNLGELYLKGTGVRQDYAEALRYFQFGADAGDSYSQTNLAYLYDRGLGVKRDVATAVHWYSVAAAAGNPMAESDLADLYFKGEGVPRDEVKAANLYQHAAEQGHTGAQIQLAYRLAQGIGIAKDSQLALAWVTAAQAAGDSRGQELLQSLRSQLHSAEVKRATAEGRELQAKSELASRQTQLQP